MQIRAAISIVPVQVTLTLSDDTPIGEIRDRIFEQARYLIENNGQEHVILEASLPELVDGLGRMSRLGFPVLTEYGEVKPPEPDWSELAQIGITRHRERDPEDDQYGSGIMDWLD